MTASAADWSQLTHAYGPAGNIPGLFACLGRGREQDSEVWSDLWSALCHQGSVYEASYAALPQLADIARGRAPGEPADAVLMAGLIVAAADADRRERHGAEIAELLPVARACLAQVPKDDAAGFVYLLQCVLAFEGVPVWSECLEGVFQEEYELDCPECAAGLFVTFGSYGCFASAGDHVTEEDPAKAALYPADPAGLTGVARRLHTMARESGQQKVAEGLTYLFGRATCPECECTFPVAERVAQLFG
ncbi:hypothetical protein [Streptomyces sp. NPDC002187]|uniref:hypothetical protein n=1 Tax=Streptomyces sp. NPDC002187 TaxID=3364637 RepID=UPI0036D016B4